MGSKTVGGHRGVLGRNRPRLWSQCGPEPLESQDWPWGPSSQPTVGGSPHPSGFLPCLVWVHLKLGSSPFAGQFLHLLQS